MIHLVYTLLMPVLILVINYWVTQKKPKDISDYINILVRSLPHQYGYVFFLYYLGNEKIADTGWAPITLLTFLIPISIVALLLKLFYWVKNKLAA
jgi:galactitol-specific phosphotransferase system IIC component